MKKIGFVGLGTMGLPMAKNLLKAGYSLRVYNRTASKARSLQSEGDVEVASSPAEVARNSEIVITMVTNNQALEEVIKGENGVLAGASAGLIIIDSSTVAPDLVQSLAKELAEKDIELLDAPVTGSEPQAIAAELAFMVGGKEEVYQQCIPLFEAMGKQSHYMGGSGLGAYTKLANNTMSAINLLSLSEALILASKAGVDPQKFMEVASGGGARSGMMDNKGPKIINRDFHPNFKTELMHKDLGLALNVAAEMNIPVPLLASVREQLRIAMAKGYAEEDMCAVAKCYEEWDGVEIKKNA
ncbi:NAD(P)-dependent oxidoreductase [Alkalihalobacillus oceani]|uniref:NAD(P)-dependent oxidoreductase n=1 Tax=Halalkalibacter oceani TaxID=1653776 RepID=A0A9X2DT38_9BACI|nr:NAD(P)-dependent oxidoreductase [Halalkalibacter oceani]MCM3716206.1 NAD(P)-dependent oxidoreductase [Halalkalibacter oceani]